MCIRDRVRLAREFAASASLAKVCTEELGPGPEVRTDTDVREFIRREIGTLYHPVGTCAMGAAETAVVDPQLRVRGIENLRVADASVMPAIPRGNTNAPVIMIAEKAADLIRGRLAPTIKEPLP